jgi:hypothetical protein
MLPENLFINLLDMELQEKILNGKEIDLDVKNAMETLLEEGPTNLQNDFHDWKIEEVDRRQTIFYKGKNYIPKTKMTGYCKDVSQSQNGRTPWETKNIQWNQTTLLVARIINVCKELHTRMRHLPTVQNKLITVKPSLHSNQKGKYNETVCPMLNGLDH